MGISQIIQKVIRSIGLSARGTVRIDHREYDHMPHKREKWSTNLKMNYRRNGRRDLKSIIEMMCLDPLFRADTAMSTRGNHAAKLLFH
jgi:hypothetical protein